MLENAIQQSAHCHQLDTANMQTDYADERHGLGFLLQNEDPHIVQPQLGGQHRASRPAPGNDHVEHEGRAIGAGGRRAGNSGDVAHGEVALDRIVRRRLGGELPRVHRCCLSGVPCWRGAPGDTYVNRPTVTGSGSTHIDTAFMGLTSSGGVTVSRKLQAPASPRPILSRPRDHDSARACAVAGRTRRGGLEEGPAAARLLCGQFLCTGRNGGVCARVALAGPRCANVRTRAFLDRRGDAPLIRRRGVRRGFLSPRAKRGCPRGALAPRAGELEDGIAQSPVARRVRQLRRGGVGHCRSLTTRVWG